jgi:hypothetical protein
LIAVLLASLGLSFSVGRILSCLLEACTCMCFVNERESVVRISAVIGLYSTGTVPWMERQKLMVVKKEGGRF